MHTSLCGVSTEMTHRFRLSVSITYHERTREKQRSQLAILRSSLMTFFPIFGLRQGARAEPASSNALITISMILASTLFHPVSYPSDRKLNLQAFSVYRSAKGQKLQILRDNS